MRLQDSRHTRVRPGTIWIVEKMELHKAERKTVACDDRYELINGCMVWYFFFFERA